MRSMLPVLLSHELVHTFCIVLAILIIWNIYIEKFYKLLFKFNNTGDFNSA